MKFMFHSGSGMRVIILLMFFLQNGLTQNVGIGTTNPTAKLEVAGEIKVYGRIINVTDPVSPQDAATKNYVDQMAEIMLDAGFNGVVMDIDGNTYKTIKLDTQVWMVENLKTTRYNDGTMIPKITEGILWSWLTTPAYCWYNNDSTLNAKIYGALYKYYTVADTNSLNVCPIGWHIPSNSEWNALINFLAFYGYGFGGSEYDIGKSLASPFRWSSSPVSGNVGNDPCTNNSCGFAALPGGYRYDFGSFHNIGENGYWWSSTEYDATLSLNRFLYYESGDIYSNADNKNNGLSVRCLRN